MASPVKPGGPPQRDLLDRYRHEHRPTKGIQEAMDSREYDIFDIRVLVVRLVEADRATPKYHRLGMETIAWIYGVSLRSAYNWWAAYKKGGVDALRNDMWRPGPKPKVAPEVLEEVADELLERRKNAVAQSGKGDGDKPAAAAGDGDKPAAAAGDGDKECECPGCLASAGTSCIGRDGVERPGRKGWRPGTSGASPRARPPRCKCSGMCMTAGRKQKPRKDCKCADGTPCKCPCCRPTKLPPPGPPHVAGCPALCTAPPNALLPEEFGEAIFERTGVRYSRNHLYTLLAALDLTPKSVTLHHANRAMRRNVMRWQRRLDKRLARLRARGYKVAIVDEAFLVHNTRRGRKYWALVGRRIHNLYTGSHKTVAIPGSLCEDGSQLFREYARADSYAFVDYLKEMTAKWGKVAVIADNYSVHCSAEVQRFIRRNRKANNGTDVVMVYLPKGCPFLNAVEKCWNRLKRDVSVGEHHASFDDLRRAVSLFTRTTRFGYNIYESLYSNPPPDSLAA